MTIEVVDVTGAVEAGYPDAGLSIFDIPSKKVKNDE